MENIKEYIVNNEFNCICKNIYTNIINESNEDKKVKVEDIQPMQIPSKEILQKIVDISNPQAPSKDKGGKGLYAFNDLLKKESNIAEVGKAPLYPVYVCFMTNDGGKDPKSTKFYGIAGFSTKFFTKKNKAIQDIEPDILKQMKNFLHILIWQTDPEYAKIGLAKRYIEILKEAAKEAKCPAITIQKVDEKTTEIYKGLGFKEHEKLNNYLLLPLKKD